MENNLAVQAKVALTNLYHWAVDQKPLDTKPSTIASQASSLVSSFVESYLNPSHTQPENTHSLYLHYQPPHHTATPASSSSGAGSCGEAINHQAAGGGGSYYRNNPQDSPHSFFDTILQSFGRGGYTSRFWDPVASFDSFLWNYTPDIHAFQEKLLQGLGTGGLVEKYNIDPRIVALVLLLPLVVLILITCVVMGAGGSSVEGEGFPGRKTDPTLVGGSEKGKSGRSESKKQGAGPGGSSSSSVSGSASSKGGKKQGGPSDANQYLLGNNSGVSSWSALLGSMGFLGGETMDFKPLDIFASMPKGSMATSTSSSSSVTDPNNVDHESTTLGSVFESMSALGGEMMKHIPYQHLLDQDIAQLLGSDFLDSDNPGDEEDASIKPGKNLEEPLDSTDHSKKIVTPGAASYASIAATPVVSLEATKAIPPTTATTAATKSPAQNQEHESVHDIQKQEENTGRQSRNGPAGPGDDSLKTRVPSISPPLRTRTPRPSGSFRESNRPKIPSTSGTSSVAIKPASAAANVHRERSGNLGRDIGSKIFGFVQESQLLKNMDSLSGGLLGSAVATVAALASSAEATAGVIKNNLPDSVTDFTDELRESFDHAMRIQDTEHEAAKQKSWGVRDAISKIMQDEDDHVSAAAPSTPTATTTTGSTVRVSLPSGNATTAPTSFKSTAASKQQHPAEDISARPTGPVVHRVVEPDEQSELSSMSDSGDDNVQHFPRASSGGAPMTDDALTEIDTSLSKELASAMETSQETPSSLSSTTTTATVTPKDNVGVAPSAHTEHEDEDYYLEDVEDSGEEADDDSDNDENNENNDNDGDSTFVLEKGGIQADQTEGPISSRTRLQDEGPKMAVHPHDEIELSENSGSVSSSGGSIADDELPPTLSTSTSSDTLSKIPDQEMTIDARGNKVPVSSEARRDSGFDLLL
ncbi:hypothetical protein EC991_001513 [Linnemannia zychae]|nr:hypothetical protein EC991_001513 [Linnemannia zychae]